VHAEGAAHFEVAHRFSKLHDFSPEEVRAFASLAGDTNPLHHDNDAAQRSRFGELIVSGTHTTALLLGLTATHFAKYGGVVGLGFGVQFVRPVQAEARVEIGWEVTAVTQKSRGRQLLDLVGAITDVQGRICVSATGQLLVGPEI
jgi:3-hydroxybutyryl-CoA dehydratase